MYQKSIHAILILLTVFSSSFAAGQENGWKLAKSGDGVEVYTRSKEGDKVKEFKAKTTVNKSVDAVMKLIDDVSRYPEWQDNCDEAYLIETEDAKRVVARYTASTPWPFTDRDVVIEMKKEPQANGAMNIRLTSQHSLYPEKKGYVRIVNAGGFWEIEPLSDNSSSVTYQFHADPGGSVPNWLINMFIVQGPYNSLKAMKGLLNE